MANKLAVSPEKKQPAKMQLIARPPDHVTNQKNNSPLRQPTNQSANQSINHLPTKQQLPTIVILPVDMKNGILNRPSRTRDRRLCNVLPSNGKAPHTRTYSTTPKLCNQ